jgi:PHP family Zn ribbon phosphoesterase
LIHPKKARVSEVVDEQGQTPKRRPHHLRILFLQMVGDVCLSFKGAEGLAVSEELNGANGREALITGSPWLMTNP